MKLPRSSKRKRIVSKLEQEIRIVPARWAFARDFVKMAVYEAHRTDPDEVTINDALYHALSNLSEMVDYLNKVKARAEDYLESTEEPSQPAVSPFKVLWKKKTGKSKKAKENAAH